MPNAAHAPSADLDPRVRRSRDKILTAARAALADQGYEGMSIAGVAERAGVGKATIYRHWSSKAQLVIDAAADLCARDDPAPGGTPAQQLGELYEGLARRLADPVWSRASAGLMVAARRDPELERLFTTFVAARRAPARHVLRAAVAAGALPADTDVEAAIDLIAGPLFYRRFFAQRPVSPAVARALVERVLADPPRRG